MRTPRTTNIQEGDPKRSPLAFLPFARLYASLFGRPLLRSLLSSGPGLGAVFVALLLLSAFFLHLMTFPHPSHGVQAAGQWLGSHLSVGQELLAAGLGCPHGHDSTLVD